LTCIPTNKSAESDSLVVRIDLEQRAELLRQQPDLYYITDHYEPHSTVLVRLSRITRVELRKLLRDAHRFVGPVATPCARPGRLEFTLNCYRSLFGAGKQSASMSTPLLYLHGRRDGCIGVEFAVEPQGRLPPGSRLEILDAAGHFPQL
jgi:pimeloyl-ACP methyl ester carboxylesterase